MKMSKRLSAGIATFLVTAFMVGGISGAQASVHVSIDKPTNSAEWAANVSRAEAALKAANAANSLAWDALVAAKRARYDAQAINDGKLGHTKKTMAAVDLAVAKVKALQTKFDATEDARWKAISAYGKALSDSKAAASVKPPVISSGQFTLAELKYAMTEPACSFGGFGNCDNRNLYLFIRDRGTMINSQISVDGVKTALLIVSSTGDSRKAKSISDAVNAVNSSTASCSRTHILTYMKDINASADTVKITNVIWKLAGSVIAKQGMPKTTAESLALETAKKMSSDPIKQAALNAAFKKIYAATSVDPYSTYIESVGAAITAQGLNNQNAAVDKLLTGILRCY